MGFLSQPISLIPIRPVRKIGPINVQVVVQESANDVLTITKQPVQQGASITDHAYQEPTVLSMSIYFSDNSIENLISLNTLTNPIGALSNNNSLAKTYKDLLTLQGSRSPVSVVTPKRIYKNMLISALSQTTDKATENVLKIDISLQQIIIVSTSAVTVPRSAQRNPGSTGATENAGKKSALATLFGASQGPQPVGVIPR